MKDFKTLASLVFFETLYNSKQDIFSAISLMVEHIIIREKLNIFDIHEMRVCIEKYYGFEIVDPVVKTSIKKLKYITNKNLKYYVDNNKINTNNDLLNKYDKLKSKIDDIYKELIEYIKQNNQDINKLDENKIKEEFENFLYSDYKTSEYSKYIYSFLITTSNIDDINDIKKGIILHQALQYSPDSDSLIRKIPEELNIYCDTEILFSLEGYNGEIHQKSVKDFLKLVKEVNDKKKKRVIKVYYFNSTGEKIDNFFNTAKQIVEQKKNLNYNIVAMESIVKNATQPSDIVIKETKFLNNLESNGIFEQEIKTYDEIGERYNLPDKTFYEFLKKNDKTEHYDYIANIINHINFERDGKNINDFVKMKSIFLSANKTYLNGSVDLVKKGDIPHVLNIDFLTTQLWLRLNKGLGDNCKTTINVAINAQIALAALINTNIQREIENKSKDTNITQDEIAMEIAIFRSSVLKPEDITKEIIESNKEIISENIIEAKKIEIDNIKTENQKLKNKSNEQKLIIAQYERKERLNQMQKLKQIHRIECIIKVLIISLAFIAFAYFTYRKMYNIDTLTSIAIVNNIIDNIGDYSIVITALLSVFCFINSDKYKKIIFNFLKKKFKLDTQVFK